MYIELIERVSHTKPRLVHAEFLVDQHGND